MATPFQAIREAYPEYDSVSDDVLAEALYKKFGKDQDKFDYMLRLFGKGERATPTEVGVAGLKSAFQTAGAAALEKLGYEEEAQKQLEAARARQEEVAGRYQREVPSFSDIGLSPSRLGQYLYEVGGESAAYMAPSVAGGVVGGLMGGPVGAGVGAVAANIPVFTATNIQRQIEEGAPLKDVSIGRAAATAVPQSLADAFIGRYLPGIGKAGAGSLIRRTATRAIEGGLYGSASEATQQALEILQANPEKLYEFSPAVQKELIESAIAGGLLEGTTGAVTGALGKKEAAPAPPTTPAPGPQPEPQKPGPTEPQPPLEPQVGAPAENEWLQANRDRLQQFNDTPIQAPILTPTTEAAPAPAAGMIRLYYDESAAQDGKYSFYPNPTAFVAASPKTARYVDVPETTTLAKATDNTVTFANDQEQMEAIKGAKEFAVGEQTTAPVTFANMVDKALYAFAKKTNPDEYNLAQEYLTSGLGMLPEELDTKSKEVETAVDDFLAQRKDEIQKGQRAPDERVIVPEISKKPTVVTFPGELKTDKIAGIDVNTTDPAEKAKLQNILASTETVYTDDADQKIERAFPGMTKVIRTIQEQMFPGIRLNVSAIEKATTYGYMDPNGDPRTFGVNFSLKAISTPEKAVRTVFHEMFHIMEYTWLTDLPKDQRDAIIAQYVREAVPAAARRIAQTSIQTRIKEGVMSKDMMQNPEAYLKKHLTVKDGKVKFKTPGQAFGYDIDLTTKDKAGYYFGFSEWIAEKGAEWIAGSGRKVDSKLDTAFKKLYDNLKTLYYKISEFLGVKPTQGAFEQLLSEIWGQRAATPVKSSTGNAAIIAEAETKAQAAGVPVRGIKIKPTPGIPSRRGKPYKPMPLSSEVLREEGIPEGAVVTRIEPGFAATGDRLVSEAHPLTEKDVETQGINPALVGPNVPLEMQQIGAFTTARKNQGVWGRLFDFITGRVEGESHAQAMFRNSVASAIPFLSRVEYKEVGRTIERMQNVQGRISGLISIGFMDYNPVTGELKFNNKYGGLIKIFDRIGTKDEDAFQEYAIARRELDLRKAGKSGLGYKVTDAQLKQIIESAPAHFKEVAAEFENYNKGMIQFSLDSGLIPKELADRFMSMFYVPFYRVQEDGTANMGTLHPKITKALEDPKGISAFNQSLDIGGMVERGFYDNILRNYSTIVAAGLKNIAYNSVAKAALTADGKAIDTSIAEPVGKPGGDGVITYRVNGGDQYLKINDVPMFQSLAAMSPKQLGAFTEAASKAANVLRTGVTIAPPFQIANLWRGIIDTYVKTGMPITDLIAGTFKNFREVYRKGPSYQAILAATGFGGYGYGAGFRDQAEFMRRAYTSADISKPWGLVMKALDKLEHIGEATEMASRVTYRDYLVKKGVDPTTAAYEAVNLTNFNRSGAGGGVVGNTLMQLIPMIPFLNARVQGLYRLIETDTAGAPKSWLAKGTIGIPIALVKRGLQLTAIELALNMIYGDDDWYKKLSVEDKIANNYFRFNDTVIAAPRAFEIGSVFGAIPALMMDAIRQKEGSQFTDGLIQILSSTFLFNPIPQAVKPIAEVMVNKDMFTWRDIETIADKNRLRKERFDESTTEVAKALSEVTPFSPKQADILIRGYLGTMGTVFASIVDGFVSEAGVRPQGYFGDPTSKIGIAANATGLSRFVKDPETMRNRFVKDFYDMKLSVTQVTRSINDAGDASNIESLKEKLKNDPAAQTVYKVLNRAESQINDINKQMNNIRLNPNLSAEEKTKRLTALRNIKNQTAEQAFRFGRQYGYE